MTRLSLAARDTFRSLHSRNFRLFFTGQLISQVGNWLTLVAQALFVLRLTDNGLVLGLLAAAHFGPVLVLGPWAGLVADRSDKRRLLLIVQAIAMVQSFVLAGLAFWGTPPLALVFGVALIGGVTVAFDNPARRSFVVEMVEPNDMANAVSLNSTLMTGSRVVGPVLAGVLITTVGFGWCFLLDGVSYLAVLACLALMRTSELRPAPVTPRGRGQVRAGLRYARSNPLLWVPLVMMGVVGTLTYNFQTVLPLLAKRDLGGDDTTFTFLLSALSLGSLIGALAVARRSTVAVRTIAFSSCAFGVAMFALSVAPNAGVAYLLAVPLGVASIVFLTSSTAIVQMESSPEMRGRVLALQAMVFLGSTPIGGPILGFVSEYFGARYGVVLGGVAAIAAGVWGLVRTSERRSAPSVTEAQRATGRFARA